MCEFIFISIYIFSLLTIGCRYKINFIVQYTVYNWMWEINFIVLIFKVGMLRDVQSKWLQYLSIFCVFFCQIETENGNKTVANLERILEDYKAIRQENSALTAKVREGWKSPWLALFSFMRLM